MAPLTFVEVLKREVGRMQAMHPEREGELSRAHALILQGMVTPTDDPTTAHVLSSDGQKRYTVNGTCECQAGQHGKPCKHRQSWLLYQHVIKKVKAQPTPEVVGVDPNNSPLPEAPASVNVRLLVADHEVQWTLRGHDEAQVFARLASLLRRADVKPIPKPVTRSGTWKRGNQGR